MKEKERERQKENKSSVCWFTSEIPATTRTGSGWSREPGTLSGSPKYLSHHFLLPRVRTSKKLVLAVELGLKPGTVVWDSPSQVMSLLLCQMPAQKDRLYGRVVGDKMAGEAWSQVMEGLKVSEDFKLSPLGSSREFVELCLRMINGKDAMQRGTEQTQD